MNDNSSFLGILFVAIAAIGICAGTFFYLNKKDVEAFEEIFEPGVTKKNSDNPKVEENSKTNVVKNESKNVVTRTTKVTKPLNEEEQKAKERKELEEAGKEMYELYKGSKMEELVKKRMTEGNMKWFSDLFKKYNIDPENQQVIAQAVTDAHTGYMKELMANGFLENADDEKRAEVAERLKAIDKECEDEIVNAGGEAFLAEAEEKRKTELRNQYLNGIDYSLGKSRMSDKQRAEMDLLYERNQITEAEVWQLPKHEIEQRTENINNGAKEILDEEQYKSFMRTDSSPFDFRP